jgi:hypothetical protein
MPIIFRRSKNLRKSSNPLMVQPSARQDELFRDHVILE